MQAVTRVTRRLGWIGVCVAALAGPAVAARPAQSAPPSGGAARDLVSKADAVRLREKVATIEQHASLVPQPGARAPQPAGRSTVVSEREVNSYLAFEAGPQIPVGITGPRIAILGDRRLAATALVDLDAVRAHHKSSGWFDPVNLLSGRLPVAVSGRLQTADGVARFDLESASISNVPDPEDRPAGTRQLLLPQPAESRRPQSRRRVPAPGADPADRRPAGRGLVIQ